MQGLLGSVTWNKSHSVGFKFCFVYSINSEIFHIKGRSDIKGVKTSSPANELKRAFINRSPIIRHE